MAFNCRQLVQEPGHYFNLFRVFDHWLYKKAWECSLEFHWELQNVTFRDPKCDGWTLATWITTLGSVPSEESARELWEFAVRGQTEFLLSSGPSISERIY